ncbi:MAG: TAXI family TRAP transporter solute-binding subunit [Alphaproteobacteria bacterium]|nr:TAXI family TRAP transporter solute-binding subunit [Alphaproteobacteria bacterium]
MIDKSPAGRPTLLRLILSALLPILATLTTILPAWALGGQEVFASIGTGELNGIYFPVTKAICEIVNQDLPKYGVRCSPEATPGSVYNIEALRTGELEFAVVQSDVQFAAYNGEDRWTGGSFRGLRSVLSLYPELVTVVARSDSHIRELAGLAGRRLNVGARGSGTRATWDAIEAQLGWKDEERVHPTELKPEATTSALCTGTIDANLLIVGHPSPVVAKQLAACATNLVAITGPAVDKLVHDHRYYQRGTIPASLYGIAADVPTFGGRATLVTSASTDGRVVAIIARAVLTHLAELRALHPVLAGLRTREMINDGLTAPLHPAAEQVYKELGLLE